MPDKTYTTYEIAKFCDVYPSTVIHWINNGKLKAYLTPGGHHRVTKEVLVSFLRQFEIPLPPQLSASRKRVLIVDDEPEIGRLLERAFARHGERLETEVRRGGVEALIRIGQAPPDLVILDIVLPGMDGFQVCDILKSKPETRAIKIIAITGNKLHVTEKKLEEARIDAFFRKPLDLAALLSKAARLLETPLGAEIV